MSPLLFSLFVKDIEEFLANKGVESVDFYNDVLNRYLKLFVVMYADDTLIMANRPEKLQEALDNTEQYCNHWKLDINCAKTKITVFGQNVKDQSLYNFTYKGEKLEVVNSFKYLGVTLSAKGSYKQCITELKQ